MLLLESQPVEIENAVVLPCPLIRNKDNTDPTVWLRNLNWDSISSTKPRIVLAMVVFMSLVTDYSFDEEANLELIISLILIIYQPMRSTTALGDWHNLKEVSKRHGIQELLNLTALIKVKIIKEDKFYK